VLARALGKEAKDDIYQKNASEIFNKYVCGSEKRFRAIFQIAQHVSTTIHVLMTKK
jgi:AAA+ superfamily predicted ATPase